MTSEPNTYTVNFQLSSGDGGVLTTADFNNLERKDLRNCSSLISVLNQRKSAFPMSK